MTSRSHGLVEDASIPSVGIPFVIVGGQVVVGHPRRIVRGRGRSGKVACVVAERRRELAIHAALGATRARLVSVATRDALIAVGLGVVGGLAGADAGSGVLARFLFHVAPRSTAACSTVALLVLTVATLAAWGPLSRFNRTSLMAVLKAE